jgi:hypothetical protein
MRLVGQAWPMLPSCNRPLPDAKLTGVTLSSRFSKSTSSSGAPEAHYAESCARVNQSQCPFSSIADRCLLHPYRNRTHDLCFFGGATILSSLESMAGTTGLEPATSAVTVLPF